MQITGKYYTAWMLTMLTFVDIRPRSIRWPSPHARRVRENGRVEVGLELDTSGCIIVRFAASASHLHSNHCEAVAFTGDELLQVD